MLILISCALYCLTKVIWLAEIMRESSSTVQLLDAQRFEYCVLRTLIEYEIEASNQF